MSICKRLLCVLLPLLLLLVVSSPVIANASSSYPTIDDYRVSIEYNDKIEYQFKAWYGNVEKQGILSIGQSLTYGGNYTYGLRFYLDFNLNDYLLKYMSLIKNSTNAWLQINLDLDVTMTPAGSGTENVVKLYYNENDTSIVMNSTPFDGNHVSGNATFSPCELTNLTNISASDDISTGLEFYSYTGTSLTHRECEFIMRSYTLVLYLEGVDGQSHDEFIVITNKLDGIESAINGVRDGVEEMRGQLDNIDESINQGFDDVNKKQDTIIDKITSGFANIGNQVKKAVIDAVTELFVPSEQDMVAQYDKWDALMADRFGAVYESSQIIDNFVESIKVSDAQETINFPVVSVDLVGITFEFGGWEVDVVPDGFQWLVDILKMVSNIGCTVLFINGMRSRYESVVK